MIGTETNMVVHDGNGNRDAHEDKRDSGREVCGDGPETVTSLLESRPLVSLEDENPVHWHVLRKDSPAVHRHAKDTRNMCGGPYATTSEAHI